VRHELCVLGWIKTRPIGQARCRDRTNGDLIWLTSANVGIPPPDIAGICCGNVAWPHGTDRYLALRQVMVDKHGEMAPIECAMTADAFLEQGDPDGQWLWLAIRRAAISLLENGPPNDVSNASK
jgi:hypothetical protein